MRSKPLIESAATVENMDLINSTPGLANLLISPLRRNMLSERDVEPHMIKAFCCLNNLVACECLSAWSWAKRRSWRSDRTTDLIFHYILSLHFLGRYYHKEVMSLQMQQTKEPLKNDTGYIS